MSSRILRVTAAALSLPLVLGITACSEQQSASSTDSSADTTSASGIDSTFTGSAEIPEALSEPLDVALVIRTTQGGWLEAYTDAVETEVAALGGSLQIYDSQNDLSKMSSNVDTAVNADVDLLLIDSGTQDALGTSVQKAIDADIPVVAYDSDFTIDGVVSVSQDDTALARNGLEQIKTDFGGTAKIVVISVAGYTPLDNRLAEVESFISENPGIEIVAQTGTVSGSASLDTAAQVEAILKAYPDEGEIDAIWTHWNDFSVGAYQALKSQNRSDVALYTVDLTDQN